MSRDKYSLLGLKYANKNIPFRGHSERHTFSRLLRLRKSQRPRNSKAVILLILKETWPFLSYNTIGVYIGARVPRVWFSSKGMHKKSKHCLTAKKPPLFHAQIVRASDPTSNVAPCWNETFPQIR